MHQIGLMYCRRVVTDLRPADASPPAFLRLAGDQLRWRLLSELARSDRRVGELTRRRAGVDPAQLGRWPGQLARGRHWFHQPS
jgi:hypothetical protein